MKAVKTIAALIFMSALAIVLVQPVLGADDEPPARDGSGREEAAEGGGDEASAGEPVELTARYPKRCMRKSFEPTGLVAAKRGGSGRGVVRIGFPDQPPAARIEVAGEVAWSPTGTFLAESGGRVYDQSGNPQGALFFEPVKWQWSPVADCALATTERGNLTFSIADTKRKGIRLVNAPVQDFELSPNGRRLAIVVADEGGLWIADLRGGRVTRATEHSPFLLGWYSNRAVLYSKSRHGGLRYATGAGEHRRVRRGSVGRDVVVCRSEALVLTDTPDTDPEDAIDRLVSRRGRIKALDVRSDAPAYNGFSAATCSPDGRFMAVTSAEVGGRGALMLLEADGTFVRKLVGGRTASPQWSEEGLLYARYRKSGRGRLWLVAPGSPPVPTAYRVGAPTEYDWHVR